MIYYETAQGQIITASDFRRIHPNVFFRGPTIPKSIMDMYSLTVSDYRPPVTNLDVNTEREIRITKGCTVNIANVGTIFVTGKPEDIRNMAGLGQGAIARLLLGDANTVVPYRDGFDNVYNLTPPQMLELWQKSAGYVSQIYQASWDLKANTIPSDYSSNNAYWPSNQL